MVTPASIDLSATFPYKYEISPEMFDAYDVVQIIDQGLADADEAKNFVSELVNISSTDQIEIKKATIYPNPTSSDLQIVTEGDLQSYELYAIDGRAIQSSNFPSNSQPYIIELDGLQGVFNLLLIFEDGTIQSKRVVIY